MLLTPRPLLSFPLPICFHPVLRYTVLLFFALAGLLAAQEPPYTHAPPVQAPSYRVRYDASTQPGALVFPVSYTLWIPPGALQVPVMCNLGTKEGVTVKTNQFAGVWPGNETFFSELRGRGGRGGVAIDPLTSHESGNSRSLFQNLQYSDTPAWPLVPMCFTDPAASLSQSPKHRYRVIAVNTAGLKSK